MNEEFLQEISIENHSTNNVLLQNVPHRLFASLATTPGEVAPGEAAPVAAASVAAVPVVAAPVTAALTAEHVYRRDRRDIRRGNFNYMIMKHYTYYILILIYFSHI